MQKLPMLLVALGLLPSIDARAEVTECNVIAAVPAVVDRPGIWCLKSDLSWNSSGTYAIEIRTSNVTLDFNGFTLSQAKSPRVIGIFGYDLHNVTIRNGTVRGFDQGIQLSQPPSALSNSKSGRHLVEAMTIEQSELFGIDVSGKGNIVRNNHVFATQSKSFTQTMGILIEDARDTVVAGNIISGTTAVDHAIGIQIYGSETIEVRNNSILDTKKGVRSASGVYITAFSKAVTVDGNRIVNSHKGTNGILGESGVSSIICINNVVVGFEAPMAGCGFESGNLVP